MTAAEKKILIRKRLARAEIMLGEIKNLIPLGYYETSVNRIYYACFYCVQALLAKIDIYPKSHKGVLTMFNLHYVKETKFRRNLGQFYQNVFDQRLMADYDDTYEISKDMIGELLENALIFFEHSNDLLQEK